MVVSSPQEFPLTRENVILIRQFLFLHQFLMSSISFLLPIIHPPVARPGNENLVALQPTVSRNLDILEIFMRDFETLALWEFSGDICRSIDNLCLSWRPSLFVSRGAEYELWESRHLMPRKETWAAMTTTRGAGGWISTWATRAVVCLQVSAGVQEQLCGKYHRLSALVRTVLQNKRDFFSIFLKHLILTRFHCGILRYLPNTDTPMCDPWAAVQFNKHQCKWEVRWKVESNVFVYSPCSWRNMQTLPPKLWRGKRNPGEKYFYLECSSILRLNFWQQYHQHHSGGSTVLMLFIQKWFPTQMWFSQPWSLTSLRLGQKYSNACKVKQYLIVGSLFSLIDEPNACTDHDLGKFVCFSQEIDWK